MLLMTVLNFIAIHHSPSLTTIETVVILILNHLKLRVLGVVYLRVTVEAERVGILLCHRLS